MSACKVGKLSCQRGLLDLVDQLSDDILQELAGMRLVICHGPPGSLATFDDLVGQFHDCEMTRVLAYPVIYRGHAFGGTFKQLQKASPSYGQYTRDIERR